MFGIAEIIRKIMIDSMWSWELELTSSGENLRDLHIQEGGGIFQGDSLFPTLSYVWFH